MILGLALMLSACGDSDSSSESSEALELESAKKALFFYGASTNDHYSFDTETQALTDLNSDTEALHEFKMDANDDGRLFVWIDNKGDTNSSNDEDKVLMFDSDYSFADDGDATWEDFHYLGHYHDDDLAAHTNEEFDVTSGSKYDAMVRLNIYLQEQETLKTLLAAQPEITSAGTTICDHYTVTHEEENETHYFVLGTDGTLYTYEDDGAISFKDQTVVTSAGCTAGRSGMSAAEDGVLIYLQSKLYLVDSHDDGVTHVHSEWDISEVLGDGKGIDMMVGIRSLDHDDEDHDH